MDNKIISQFRNNSKKPNVAVIGDLMLDHYIEGDVDRVSPEAPVPVVSVINEYYRFGGSANVVYNLLNLGANPIPLGIIGEDSKGSIFKSLFEESGIDTTGILIDKQRPTTVKTRVLSASQQLLRVDSEMRKDISDEKENTFIDYLKNQDNLDAIIIQDYNKGVITKNLINALINFANENDILIAVDPKKENISGYKNSTLFKPNKKELEFLTNITITDKHSMHQAINEAKNLLNPHYLLVTLGAEGMILVNSEGEHEIYPSKVRNVADVSGAGDTVISTLVYSLAIGIDYYSASEIANIAAGLVCEEIGVVPIKKETLALNL